MSIWKVLTLSETLNIETDDVYEAPLLAEVGDFADLTQGGNLGNFPEGGGTWWLA
ncbi:lasso RiPP family leader peptide-containing protein [Streptomyces sp. NPDC056004]|uniref:lasso RiPP family leader peptide-containing protein n=1 Tax=Streptomyces sp. NPDC056004 TaxID=3345677 RepID=UPI0035E29798